MSLACSAAAVRSSPSTCARCDSSTYPTVDAATRVGFAAGSTQTDRSGSSCLILCAVRAVLFDFAGTLFMPRAANELVVEATRALGLDLAADDLRRLADDYTAAGVPGGPYPATVPDHVESLYERRDLSPDTHRAAYLGLLSNVNPPHPDLPAAIYERILEPDGWVPYADAREVVEELGRRGVRAGLISNVGFDVRPILRAHGFGQLARSATLSFEVGVIKPDRRIFEAALAALGSDAAETLMVGDHPEVDRGAEVLGIRTLILPMTPAGGVHGLTQVLSALGEDQRRSSARCAR
jgi:HAD superfamily hydrolase (TIGR01509 family)